MVPPWCCQLESLSDRNLASDQRRPRRPPERGAADAADTDAERLALEAELQTHRELVHASAIARGPTRRAPPTDVSGRSSRL
eukprot:SAG22_NODE_933_length_6434_cov_5.195264_5_plen_82_part_00